jgi:hypothetical protein
MSWSVLQSAGAGATSGGNNSVTLPSNVSSGTKLIAYVGVSNTGGAADVTAVSDNNSNQFTEIASTNFSTTSVLMSMWVLDTPAGDVGSMPTITATAGSSLITALVVEEVSGLATGTSASLDGSAGAAHGSGNPVSASYSSSASNEFLVSFFVDGFNAHNTTGVSGSTSYTTDAHNVNSASSTICCVAYGNSTGGAETATWTTSSTDILWTTLLVAFKLAGGGTPHTATGSLTVTPSFSLVKAEGHVQSAVVTPAFSMKKAEAHVQAATITPVFSALGVKNYGKGGTPDRHHRRSWNPR